jgi:hypothetical protein
MWWSWSLLFAFWANSWLVCVRVLASGPWKPSSLLVPRPRSLGDNLPFSMSLVIQNFYLTQGISFVQSRNVEGPEGLGRKQACLALLLHFLDTYQGLLQEEEGAGHIIKVGLGGERWVSWLSALPGAPMKDSCSSSWGPGSKKMPWGFALWDSQVLKAWRPCLRPCSEWSRWDICPHHILCPLPRNCIY